MKSNFLKNKKGVELVLSQIVMFILGIVVLIFITMFVISVGDESGNLDNKGSDILDEVSK